MIEHEVELLLGLFHLVSFEQTDVRAAEQMVQVVHENLIGMRVEQRGLSEVLSFLLLRLLPVATLDVVGSESVQTTHLIGLLSPMARGHVSLLPLVVDFSTGRFENLHEVLLLVLTIVLQLETGLVRGGGHGEQHTYR